MQLDLYLSVFVGCRRTTPTTQSTQRNTSDAAEALSVLKTTADSMLCEGVTDHVTPIKVSTACTDFVCTVLSF